MTRAQRGFGDGRPEEPRANDTRAYDRRNDGWAAEGRGPDGWGNDGGWGSDIRAPDRRLDGPRRPRVRVEPQPQPQPADGLPPINPYAVVALVAALLGLFPVAVVFGFIAFTHRGGRRLAVAAVVLGVLEMLAIVGVLVVGGGSVSKAVSGLDDSTSTVAAPPAAAVAPAPPAAAAPPAARPAAVAPAQGTSCGKSQVGVVGTAADSSTLVCLYVDQAGKYQWSAPQTLVGGVYENGASCDSSVAIGSIGQTSDGHALLCTSNSNGRTWQSWTES